MELQNWDQILRDESFQAVRLAKIIVDQFAPKTLLDVGCGPGIYTNELRKLSVEAYGLDIDPRLETNHYFFNCDLFDFSNYEHPHKLNIYDAILCLEVAEHIETRHSKLLVKTLCELSDTLIFSAAVPGQSGIGHINCQYKEFWIDLFLLNNFTVDNVASNLLLESVREGYHCLWLANNSMVLRKNNLV